MIEPLVVMALVRPPGTVVTRTAVPVVESRTLITPGYLRELAAAPAPAATRQPDGHAGVPARLNHALMVKVTKLTGDSGAGPLLRKARLLDPPPGMLRDVDTAEDLAQVERILTRVGVRKSDR